MPICFGYIVHRTPEWSFVPQSLETILQYRAKELLYTFFLSVLQMEAWYRLGSAHSTTGFHARLSVPLPTCYNSSPQSDLLKQAA